MDIQILVTLGSSSLSEEAVKKIAQHNIYLTGPLAETDGK